MGLVEKTNIQKYFPVNEGFFHPKSYELPKTEKVTKKLIIGIYLIEEKRFLYFNEEIKRLIGKNTNKILIDGWDFWFSLIIQDQKKHIGDQISNFFTFPYLKNPPTLHYWINDVFGKVISVKHEIIIHKFVRQVLAVNFIFYTTKKERFFEGKSTFLNYSSPKRPILKISKREKEVLDLIADGFSSKQIADMLFISNHTAISHRKNLLRKFNVKNTAHLIKISSSVMNF